MNRVLNGMMDERMTPLLINAAACTDVGLRRTVNEDSYLSREPVFIVADGMGGHSAGDLASAAATRAFEPLASSGRLLRIEEVDATMEEARRAVDEISLAAERGAGCTLTGVFLVEHRDEPHWYVVNIGDSRVYQHRGARLAQITTDHSLYAELIAAGHEDADTTPRNVITRALGSDDARHDAWLLPVRTGTRLLICSDGLTTELEDEELRAVLTVGGTVEAVAQELVRRALEAGGHDNITVIVVDTVSGGRHASNQDDRVDPGDEDASEGDFEEDTLEITRQGS